MTPAINSAKQAHIRFKIHEYDHAPSAESYGEEAAIKLGVDPNRVFKTLMVALDSKDLAVAVLPVLKQLNLKLFARATGAKKAAMENKKVVERTTGYVLGGVSPVGQKKKLGTIIDESAKIHDTIYVSAGRRGLDMELAPDDLCRLTQGTYGIICK
jgi:Cys-tRNA(Pro)/Cys-tRNA(Cys) deacylase